MKSPHKTIPRVSPKKASKGFQWSTAKRSRIKKKPRKPSETLRIYGPPARRKFVTSLPCAACGVEGFSVQAHVLGNGGMGRKANYQTIAPLCGYAQVSVRSGYVPSCHMLYDEQREKFDARFPDFNPETAAQQTENLWREHESAS